MLGWVLFAVTDLGRLGQYFAAMFSGVLIDGGTWYLLRSNAAWLVLAAVGCTALPASLWKRWEERLPNGAATALRAVGVTAVLLLSMAFLVGDSYNPFLYFRF